MENNIENALVANDNVPVGTIVAFAGPTSLIPPGWLICNGDQIYQNMFPELCNIIQDYWGPTNPLSGQHHLPDLRGIFLRGVNGPRNDEFSDPEKLNRYSNNNRSNDVGSFQQDAFQGHYHDQSWTHSPSYGGSNNTEGGDQRNGHYVTELKITDPIPDGRNGTPRVATETRAKNAYVYYIIKAKSN